jgi:O-antigen/teichoic acid export membrane protein
LSDNLIDARFRCNVFFSYGTQLARLGLGFISVTLITRYGGIDVYGMVALLTALTGMLTNLMTFRTNEAVIYFYKRGEVENQPGFCRMALMLGLLLDLAMGVAAFFLIKAMAQEIASGLLKHPEVDATVAVFAGTMLSTFLRGTALGLLVAERRFKTINSLALGEQALKALLIAVIVVLDLGMTLEHVVLATLAAAASATCVVYFLPISKLFGDLRSAVVPREGLRKFLGFSANTFFSSSLKFGNQNIDAIILGYVTTPALVGVYSLFRQFINPINMMAVPFTLQVYPQFVSAIVKKRPDLIRATITHANRLLSGGGLGLFLVVVPVLIYYGRWNKLHFSLDQYLAFGVMFLSVFVIQQMWWTRPFANSVNPTLSVKAGLLASAILPVATFVLTARFGLVGTACGVLLTNVALYRFWKSRLSEIVADGKRAQC